VRLNVAIAAGMAATLVFVDHAIAEPTASDLQTAIAAKSPPALKWQGNTGLTIRTVSSGTSRQVTGQCHARRQVVILDGGTTNGADCQDGRYTARIRSNAGDRTVATQILPDGNMVAARLESPQSSSAGQRVAPANLAKALTSARPGERLVVEPGTYADAAINLTQGGGADGRPVVIDGNNAVTFTGATQIQVGAGNVVLRGFTFRDVGIGAITITAPNVRVTESSFVNCGEAKKPQAECVIVRLGGKNVELDFNTFVGSHSMSIKIRAGADRDRSQPVNAFIHHNVFRDITRQSGNGQEPIQIAGPNGGGSNAELRTRIEHNLFYRAEGDREAVSIKTPGTTLRWNVFRDMDAAPNIRGSRDAVVTDNLLIRTRPVRINGSDHRVERNVILCPAAGVGFVVSHGSPGYETAANSLISDNVVATKRVGILFGAQTQPLETMAHGNKIVSNTFHVPKNRPMYEFRPAETESRINHDNSLTGSQRGPDLCS
jgi:Chondroitinase B